MRYERLSRKISQEKIADALGITRATYHKKENGIIKISVEEFSVILTILNIPHSEAGIFFERIVPERELTKY
ncbi:helix-turn-helix domain-containing protein [Piscibacillus salipiscarius]|uniref:Helix-turn-helix domain-containing protein n=1 Tax=Piscibacillus salipiscarius TaxID=299480 RepID=A0ABW5Q9D7_9BACI